METTLQILLDRITGLARTYYEGNQGEMIVPTFFAVDKNDRMIVLVAPWRNDAEQDVILQTVKEKFQENDIVMYGVVSEYWMSKLSVKEGVRPIDADDRVEAVCVIVADAKETMLCSLKITRSSEGAVVSLDKMPGTEKAQPIGDPRLNRMAALLLASESPAPVTFRVENQALDMDGLNFSLMNMPSPSAHVH